MRIPAGLRHILSYFSFSMATGALSFVAVIVLTRFISPQEYGRIGIFFSLLFVVTPMISLSADNLILVKKAELDPSAYERFKHSYITLVYMIFAAVQVGWLLLFPLGLLTDALFALVPLFGLIRFLAGVAAAEYVLEEKSVPFGLLNLATALTSLALTVALVSLFSETAEWRIVAMMASESLILFVRYKGRMWLLTQVAVDREAFRRIAKFGVPLLLSVAAAWALNEADKIIVAKLIDVATAGLYTAACAVGSVMIVFNQSVVNALAPRIYRELRAAPGRLMAVARRYVAAFLLLSMSFGGVFALMYGVASEYVLPEKYADARTIVFVIILAAMANSIYRPLGLITDFFEMSVARSLGLFYGGALTIVVAVVGVTHFGVLWAAIAVGAGHVALSITLWLKLHAKAESLRVAP